MPAYIIVEIAIEDQATYERYKPLAAASLAKYGAKYLSRGGVTTALEGSWAPERFVILEFESAGQARRWGRNRRAGQARRSASAQACSRRPAS